MCTSGGDAAELFSLLEGGGNRWESAAAQLHSLYSTVRDPWLARGLVGYHARTGSARALDLLARAPDAHAKYALDALADSLRAPDRATRSAGLATLAQLVMRRPAYLHRLTAHPLLRELLRALRTERDAVPLLNALLALVALSAAAPAALTHHFSEIAEVFARLAACDTAPGRREHLQLGLYALFHSLYATHPCSLLDFLRQEYARDGSRDVFEHTVAPMLESVRLHPALVTGSRQLEAGGLRWSRIEHHDLLAECRRLSLEGPERGREEELIRFRPRCATDAATHVAPAEPPARASSPPPGSGAKTSRECGTLEPGSERWFALTDRCDADSAPHTPLPAVENLGGSPPEAAVEATPENTPVKEPRAQFNFPGESSCVRAIGRHSQPPSPLRKEASPLAADACNRRLAWVVLDRAQAEAAAPPRGGSPHRQQGRKSTRTSVPNSPVPIGGGAPSASADWPIARPEPNRPMMARQHQGAAIATAAASIEPLNVEDREVFELTARGDEAEPGSGGGDEEWCEGCGEGESEAGCLGRGHGLHMPRRRSVLQAARGVADRLRLYSVEAEGRGRCIDRGAEGKRRSSGMMRSASSPSLRERTARTLSMSVQTVDAWPAPYEYLLADFYRDVGEKTQPQVLVDGVTAISPSERLDTYLARLYAGAAAAPAAAPSSLPPSTAELLEQLALTHAQLMYERWRREAHAERNRRLLGRCRHARDNEQQNAALRDRVRALNAENDALRRSLAQRDRTPAPQTQPSPAPHDVDRDRHPAEERCSRLEAELAAEIRAKHRAEVARDEVETLRAAEAADVQRLRADLFEATRRLEAAEKATVDGERRADRLRALQRELLILGEREARLAEATATAGGGSEAAAQARLAQHYKEEAAAARAEAAAACARAEACAARDVELENASAVRDAQVVELKRTARLAAEEAAARLASVEDKYRALQHVLRRMEVRRLEVLAGCGGVASGGGGGVASPQSSPLSSSLASADGPLAARPELSEVNRVRHLLEDGEEI